MAGLTDLRARNIKPDETLADGTVDGLSLIAGAKAGCGRWEMRFTSPLTRKRRFMGLGSFPEVGVADARAAAFSAREQIRSGIDPIEARKAAKQNARFGSAIPTFKEVTGEVIADQRRKAGSSKASDQWEYLLGPKYCRPLLGLPVDKISAFDVKAVLAPLLDSKPETARKLHWMIRSVGEYARIRLREKHGKIVANFADWSDLKVIGISTPRQLSRGHHPALDYEQMPEFMSHSRASDATVARLLEFSILTAVRSGTARKATWSQIDMNAAIWTVPVENLKDGKHRSSAFRIPLSQRALAIVNEMAVARVGDYVFPGREQRPMSESTMRDFIQRDKQWFDPDGKLITVHGFRATFKTWGTRTRQDRDLIEMALGHVVGSSVERAYQRDDLLELRRTLFDAWAQYCEPNKGDKILAFSKSSREA